MSYVPPTPLFTSGNAMAAAELNTNNTALRTYINVGVLGTDIALDSVETTDIVRGEYFGVTPDHQFTSGDLYTQFSDAVEINYKFWTSHIKPYDLVSTTGPYFQIQGSGKRIVLEQAADVIYSVGALCIGNGNYELTPQRRSNAIYMAHITNSDVFQTSDIITSSLGRCFTEDAAPGVGGPTIDLDGSGNLETNPSPPIAPAFSEANPGIYSRRWYSQRVAFLDLQPGIHHFFLVTNPRSDKGHFRTISSQIEVFNK